MTRRLDPSKVDKAVKLYLAGEHADKSAAAVGIGKTTFLRYLRQRGIEVRPRKITLNSSTVVRRYLAGESILALSQSLRVSRRVIDRTLDEAGVERRDHHNAGLVRMAKLTEAERATLTRPAHAARRGAGCTEEHLSKLATSRERNGRRYSPGELQMATWLADLSPVPQRAIGRYNVDLAIAPVAVEVLGGEWHMYKATHAIRSKAILNADWNLAFVWNTANWPMTSATADYVRAFVEEARRNPSLRGEYRVIRGDGELIAAGGPQDDDLASIPPARDCLGGSNARD